MRIPTTLPQSVVVVCGFFFLIIDILMAPPLLLSLQFDLAMKYGPALGLTRRYDETEIGLLDDQSNTLILPQCRRHPRQLTYSAVDLWQRAMGASP